MNKVNAVLRPSGFEAKEPGFKTPFAIATYFSFAVKVTLKFFIVSPTEVLFGPATPILIGVPAGASIYGVASLKPKLSSSNVPLR
jgi:hypothetical protein